MMFCRERDNSGGLDIGQSIAKNNDCIGALGGSRGLFSRKTKETPAAGTSGDGPFSTQ
jgi:hypothetical protein